MENVLSRTALMEHILSLVEDPESHVKELGAILEWDPSLSTSVTRKAAVSYGLSVPACTLNLALALLGSRVVKETVKYAITSRAAPWTAERTARIFTGVSPRRRVCGCAPTAA